jgi:SAM-dependent methyltransferase
MSLYEHLAPVYDELFPVNPATLDFIDRYGPGRRGRRHAIDLGSATGGHAIALAGRGWALVGVEPSPALMLRARAASAAKGLAIDFIEGDMKDIASLVKPAHFDLVLCLGNTLPHLPDKRALSAFLDGVKICLASGGKLMVQLLNYGIAGPGFAFPTMAVRGTSFHRAYSAMKDGRLGFDTELRTASGESYRDSTPLLPIRPDELDTLLRKAGFNSIEHFSGWDGARFEAAASPFLVAVAGR